jgi:MoxR-like ATPase
MQDLRDTLARMDAVVLGKPEPVRLAVACLLARGHLLVEDVPGVGKTTLARALAACLGLEGRRVQCVADLLPGDILGGALPDGRGGMRFVPGPVFTNLLLADELNRTSPRTQSALLEAMEEGAVSAEGQRHALPTPFIVIATQNPRESSGTWPLPESQLDRFLMAIRLGYPDRSSERRLLAGDMAPVDAGQPLGRDRVVALQAAAAGIHVADPVREYLLDLVAASRATGGGLSPRAALGWQRAAQAWALVSGRDAVHPEDLQAVAMPVCAHRLGGQAAVDRLLTSVAVR